MKKKIKVVGVREIRYKAWALMWHCHSWKKRNHWSTIEWGHTKPKNWKHPVWRTWRYRSLELRKYYWEEVIIEETKYD